MHINNLSKKGKSEVAIAISKVIKGKKLYFEDIALMVNYSILIFDAFHLGVRRKKGSTLLIVKDNNIKLSLLYLGSQTLCLETKHNGKVKIFTYIGEILRESGLTDKEARRVLRSPYVNKYFAKDNFMINKLKSLL